MKKLILFLLPFCLVAETSFITPKEYAAQLYKNPRGIGCNLCHGESGEGKIVAHYKHKNKDRLFAPPAINNLDFQTFYKALNERKKGMPRYFLTQKEIKALFLYVNTYQKDEAKDEE